MAKLKNISNSDVDKPCPDVFVYSNVITNLGDSTNTRTSIKTSFKLVDKEKVWINNQYLLSQLFVYIYANEELVLKRSLSSLTLSKNKDELFGEIEYSLNSNNLTIRYYCGNDIIVGDSTIEQVLVGNKIVKSSYNEEVFNYLNKNKDLRLLDISSSLEIPLDTIPDDVFFGSNCYVSYNKSKKANISYVFDLEKFLLKNSKAYRLLRNNPYIKKNILKKISVSSDQTFFYKKNITFNGYEYEKINTTINQKKLSNSIEDQKYIISVTDDNLDLNNKNKYKIKISGVVQVPIFYIIEEKITNVIDKIKNFIYKYRFDLTTNKLNTNIENYKASFLENEYKKYFSNRVRGQPAEIVEIIGDMSQVFSTVSGISYGEYASLFSTMFNPLTFEDDIFDLVLSKLDLIQNFYKKILIRVSTEDTGTGQAKITNSSKGHIDFEVLLDQEIDYNYDQRFGYDVVTLNTYNYSSAESYNGTRTISFADKISRLNAEVAKYTGSGVQDVDKAIKYLSIGNMLLGENNYYFLNLQDAVPSLAYKEIFTKINQFNNGEREYGFVENVYKQLLKSNAYIKTIGHGKNTSKSIFFKDLLFDTNKESKDQSKATLNGYGIDNLLTIFTEYKYKNTLEFFKKYFLNDKPNTNVRNYSVTNSSGEVINLLYNQEANEETNAAMVILYNNFFLNKSIAQGDRYDLFCLEPALVSKLFTNKLKMYNQYYIVEKTIQQDISNTIPDYSFTTELRNYNIDPIYLNRRLQKSDATAILSEI